jgi:hypothetical protein
MVSYPGTSTLPDRTVAEAPGNAYPGESSMVVAIMIIIGVITALGFTAAFKYPR